MIPSKAERNIFYGRVIRLNKSSWSIGWKVIGFSDDKIVLQTLSSKWISRVLWDEFQQDIVDGRLKLIDLRVVKKVA
jgi:hypothetical protein